MTNISKLCGIISDYYSRNPNKESPSKSICDSQTSMYQFWLALEFISIVLKGLTVYFAFKAHNIVKKSLKIKKKRNAED